MNIKQLIKQLFCWHRWTEIEGHPYYKYQCHKCLKLK